MEQRVRAFAQIIYVVCARSSNEGDAFVSLLLHWASKHLLLAQSNDQLIAAQNIVKSLCALDSVYIEEFDCKPLADKTLASVRALGTACSELLASGMLIQSLPTSNIDNLQSLSGQVWDTASVPSTWETSDMPSEVDDE